MRLLIEWLRDVWNEGRSSYRPSADLFPQLDVPRIARQLKLAEEGKGRGRQDQPASTNSVFDELENRVVTSIEGEKRRAYDEAASQLRAARERAAALHPDALVNRLAVAGDTAIADLQAAVRTHRDGLFQKRRSFLEHEAEMQRFRERNGLHRPVDLPPSRFLHVAIVVTVGVIESVANTFMIARGHDLGIVGGAVNALAISALNVGAGCLAGFFVFPEVHHQSPIRKFVGAAGILVWIGFVGAFNLAVAHYRDAFDMKVSGDAATLALEGALQQPFALRDLVSWFLFLLGSTFSFVAAYETFRMDDPYPGYGRRARGLAEAEVDYRESKAVFLTELMETRDTKLAASGTILTELDLRRAQHQSIVGQHKQIIDGFQQHLKYLEQCCNDLLSTYRDANRIARNTPAPEYYAARWLLRADGLLPFEPLVEDATDARATKETLRTALEEQRSRLATEYDAALAWFRQLDDLAEEAADRARSNKG